MSNAAMKSARLLSEKVEAAIKKGGVSLLVSEGKGTEIALVVELRKSDAVLQAVRSLEDAGIENRFALKEQGEHLSLIWQAVTPSSIQHFSSSFGEQLTYLGVTAMHENPDSIHALNTAYCMGRKEMFDSLVEKGMDQDFEPSGP